MSNEATENQEVTEDRTARIYEGDFAQLENEIAKLNRRADKIGCPHIGFEILETNMVPDPYEVRRLTSNGKPLSKERLDMIPKVRQHTIKIVGDGPKVDGWKFVGTLDHYTIPGKVIVNAVPGETVPEQYFNVEANCDHCNKIRRRIETFVLEGVDENEGQYQLVGRNCLRDFFGHDPMYVVRFLNRIWNLIDSFDDEERWGGGSGRYETYMNAIDVLATTTAIIRTWGWMSKSAAGYDDTPTSAHVRYAFSRPFGAKEQEAKRQFMAQIKWDKENDTKEAEAAVAWLKEQEASNEYMHNLKLLEDEEMIPSKMLGYWCSLMAAFQREQDRLERQKRQQKLNEYFGTVGDRTEVRVRCFGIQYIDGYYGTVCMHRMWTEDGHTLVWFANSDAKMVKGGEYMIRATIKKHDEYKDWKQTQLSRLNVLETFETEEEAA